jgi:glycerol-3-phosphate dehydrogenase (NAD(P)+)
MRNPEAVAHIKQYHHNPHYISSAELDITKMAVSTDLSACISASNLVILAVPAAFLKDALKDLPKDVFSGKLVFSAIKGIVPDENLIVGEYMNQTYNIALDSIGVITGPCHAEEVAMEKLSYLTIACQDTTNAKVLADLLACRYIKTIVSDDIFGTEYSAVLKNIVSIASGICHGLGYGDNFQAVLIANAIQEIDRFVAAAHPITRDINDSAYLGDLLVTAYSHFSRNRTFGSMIGKGYSVKAAQLEMNMVAEGYYAAKCINEINKKLKVSTPISDAVYNILYEQKPAAVAMHALSEQLS